MTMDSGFSNVVMATSPEQPVFAPNPPILDSVVFADPKSLVATVNLTMPTTNTNGETLVALTNIKVFFGPSGSDLSGVAPVEFPASYGPGTAQSVNVTVPAWATAYDFEAEVSD